MSIYSPEFPEDPSEESDYAPQESGDYSAEEEKRKGRSQSDNLQDANRFREKLQDKLGGKEAGGAGEASGEAAGQGAGVAGEGAGAAGEGAATAAGTAAGEGAGSGAGAASGAAAGAGAGAATGAGSSAAAGTAGAAAGVAAGAGGAAAGTGAGAAAGGAAGLLGGPAAPITATAGVIIGAGAGASTNDTGRKGIIFGLIGGCGCLAMMTLFPAFVIIGLFSSGTGEAAGDPGGVGSTKLVVKKTATPTSIARGTANAQVTYTITVENKTSSEAVDVEVGDSFTTGLETTAFLALLKGIEGSYKIGTIPPGGSSSKSFTIDIPNTDYDPGWILVNTATVYGKIDGALETSRSSVTIVIGKPINVPPSFSPLHHPDSTGGYVFGQTVTNSRGQTSTHQGLDIHDNSSREVLSPFAQSAIVLLNTFDNGYGWYVILQAGEWQVYLTHLESKSNVRVGDVVDQNTFIGTMGCTGYCDGAHVHYEVRQNGTPVDPALYNALTPHP